MNFTAAGFARVRTPEFLQTLQQLPDAQTAILYLAIAACADQDGNLMFSDNEQLDFTNSHWKQLVDLLMEAKTAIIAMQNEGAALVGNADIDALIGNAGHRPC
jgi:hypothetical protein